MKTFNYLTDDQMDDIILWLPTFRDKIVPLLAQIQQGLPFNPAELSSALLYGLTISGSVMAIIGVVIFISIKRKVKS
jgi:hypothetical protein